MTVSANVLLKGAWYALEQSGHLLHDAVKLHSDGSYATATALALLAREELGKYRILLDLWRQARAGGKIFSVQGVRDAYVNHVTKQGRALLGMTYRAEGSTEMAELLRARIKTRPGTAEFRTVAEKLKQLDKRRRKRTPADRHARRIKATYVGINDYGTDWNRPAAIAKTEATNCITDAVGDYAVQLDKIAHERDSTLDSALAAWPDPPSLPDLMWPRLDV